MVAAATEKNSFPDREWLSVVFRGDDVIAVATMNMDPIASQAAEIFLHGRRLTKDEVR